jgi:hypothetical protein
VILQVLRVVAVRVEKLLLPQRLEELKGAHRVSPRLSASLKILDADPLGSTRIHSDPLGSTRILAGLLP